MRTVADRAGAEAAVVGPAATADGTAAKPTAALVTPGLATPSSFRTIVLPIANVFAISISYDAAAPGSSPRMQGRRRPHGLVRNCPKRSSRNPRWL